MGTAGTGLFPHSSQLAVMLWLGGTRRFWEVESPPGEEEKVPSALCGAGAQLPCSGIAFAGVWKHTRALVPCPGPCSAPALSLPGPAARGSCVCREFLARVFSASFHGHELFPALLQLQAFGVYGLKAAPIPAQAFQGCPFMQGRVSCLLLPWQDPGVWGQKKPSSTSLLTPNLVFSLLLQGRAVKEPHTPRLEETQGCQD